MRLLIGIGIVIALGFGLQARESYADLAGVDRAREISIETVQSIQKGMPSVLLSESIQEALLPHQLVRWLENYTPSAPGWRLGRQRIVTEGNVVSFGFTLQPEENEGHWYSVISQYMTQRLVRGAIVSRLLECPKPFESQGFQMEVDLTRSDLVTTSLVHRLYLDVCLQSSEGADPGAETLVDMQFRYEPGSYFPGLSQTLVHELIEGQVPTWIESFLESVSLAQVSLIRRSFLGDS